MTTEELTIEVQKSTGRNRPLESRWRRYYTYSIEEDKHVKVRLEGGNQLQRQPNDAASRC
jgi:hypothetical protein